MRQRDLMVMCAGAMLASGAAGATERATVREASPVGRAAAGLRVKSLSAPSDPRLRLDGPQGQLRTGYGGSMVDLFPFERGKFHLSAGPRLFGRTGRPRHAEPENLQYLPSFRPAGMMGGRGARRGGAAAMLVGYGRTVDTGLAVGIDTGVVMGRVMAPPPGAGRAMRLQARDEGNPSHMNEVARATMLYRF